MRAQQIAASQQLINQQAKDQSALTASLKQFMPPDPQSEAPAFDPARFLQVYSQNGGSPRSIEQIDAVVKMMGPGKAASMKIGQVHGVDDQGRPTMTTIDENAGYDANGKPLKILGTGPQVSPVLYPKEQGQAAYEVAQGTADAAVYQKASAGVKNATDILDQNNYIRNLLDSDAPQGPGRSVILELQKSVNALHPGTFDTSKAEALQKTYANVALTAVSKMQGDRQISDKERELLSKSVANYGNTPQAARLILDFTDAVAKREIAKAEYFTELRADDKRVSQGDEIKYYKAHPLTEYMTDSSSAVVKGVNPQKAAAAEPAIDSILNKYK